MFQQIDLFEISRIALEASEAILDVYHTDFTVEEKQDSSPLTIADKRSNEIICSELNRLYPKIPILSEEGQNIPFNEREMWNLLWVVDPLDGTKEFIKRNGEFTVNIALVHEGEPVIGVIYAPVLDTLYFSKPDMGSFKVNGYSKLNINSEIELLDQALQLPLRTNQGNQSVVASRSHLSPETKDYINKLKEIYGELDITSAGSSLKLCLVAEGVADVYPRFAPTMEWDTAAGHAIVNGAGGKVINATTKVEMTYNKESLLNPWFIVSRRGFEG